MKALQSLLLALPLVPAALLVGCSTIEVHSAFDPFTDFTAYHTYDWLGAESEGDDEPAIRAAVERVLATKGLTRAAQGAAGLRVRSTLHIEQKQQINDPYYAYSASENYDEGTLVIELIDAKGDRLVWRGTGSSRLSDAKTPEERRALIERTVDEILAEYPPEEPAKAR